MLAESRFADEILLSDQHISTRISLDNFPHTPEKLPSPHTFDVDSSGAMMCSTAISLLSSTWIIWHEGWKSLTQTQTFFGLSYRCLLWIICLPTYSHSFRTLRNWSTSATSLDKQVNKQVCENKTCLQKMKNQNISLLIIKNTNGRWRSPKGGNTSSWTIPWQLNVTKWCVCLLSHIWGKQGLSEPLEHF